MANNFIQPGMVLTLTAPGGGVSSGDGVQIGQIFGVALRDAAAGAEFELQVLGVFTLPKDTGTAWTEGALLYWDGTEVDTVATGKLLIGVAAAAATMGATSGDVRLNGVGTLQIA